MSWRHVTPVAKPRMTRRDKWLNPPRPCVAKYRAFKEECKLKKVFVHNGYHVTFHMPVMKSWSPNVKERMVGQPHTQTPDLDNLLKALLDAVFDDDSGIYDIRVSKVWAEEGSIQIEKM